MTVSLSDYLPFWKKLTPSQQNTLESASDIRYYEKGAVLHAGSDDCTGVMLVISGQIRVYTISDEGKELTLYRLLERDMCLLSASCIMRGIEFEVMILAEQDSTVLFIPSDIYKRMMEESVIIANYTTEMMASHFSDVMWLMDQILHQKLDVRLAAFLLEESELTGARKLTITHEQIANHLGSAREVITRMLKYMQSEGMVTVGRGSVTLKSMEALEKLAQSARK